MEQMQTPPPGAVAARNIKIAIVDMGTSQHALAVKAGFAPTTFGRRLARPEQFTVEELGEVAAALSISFPDLFRNAA